MKDSDMLVTEFLAGPSASNTASRRVTTLGRALILAADETASASLPVLVQQSGLEPISMGAMAQLRSYRLNPTISLLLCEEHLPDGTFRDALDFLRATALRIPVIVFSRLAEWENYLDAMRCGAYDCLRYPFRTGELQRVIRWMLEHRLLSFSADLSR